MPYEDTSETPEENPVDRGHLLVAAVLFEAGLAPLALALGALVGRNPLDGISWRARDALWGCVAALPMVGLFLAGRRWPVGPLARVKRFFDEEMKPLLGGRPTSDLALIALAAGVGEEMLFRGLLQGALAEKFGPWGALAGASTLFGLLHPITTAYVVIAGLLGAYLGAIWIASGNLLVVIIAHALYDFLALRTLLRPGSAEGLDPDSDLRV